jgi:hypothetical protein
LLLTRRERFRSFGERTGLIVGPSAVLALGALGFGLWVVTIFVALIAGSVAVVAGSSIRTRKGAAVFGLCLAGAIFAFMILVALLISNPIQRGD